MFHLHVVMYGVLPRVVFLGSGAQAGDKNHVKLNAHLELIANNYPAGKMKRTLKRKF